MTACEPKYASERKSIAKTLKTKGATEASAQLGNVDYILTRSENAFENDFAAKLTTQRIARLAPDRRKVDAFAAVMNRSP